MNEKTAREKLKKLAYKYGVNVNDTIASLKGAIEKTLERHKSTGCTTQFIPDAQADLDWVWDEWLEELNSQISDWVW